MACLTARAHVNQHLIPGLQMNLAGTLSGEYKVALLEEAKHLFCFPNPLSCSVMNKICLHQVALCQHLQQTMETCLHLKDALLINI